MANNDELRNKSIYYTKNGKKKEQNLPNNRSQYKNSEFTLKRGEIIRLMDATTNFRDRMIIATMYYLGFRRFEVCKIDIRDIDLENGRIKVIGKGNKEAIVMVGSVFPEYISNLRMYLQTIRRKEGLLFLSNRNRKLQVSRINQMLDEIAKKAGITNPNPYKKHLNPHILRHSIARHLKDLKYPNEFVKNYMRHDSIQTTMDAYGTMSVNEMEDYAIRKRKEEE